MKKIIFLVFILFTNLACAQTCPLATEVKAGSFNGWQPLDIDNGEPVTGNDLIEFQNKVAAFALAGWMPDAPEGSGQCYYYGDDHDPDYLDVYLAKTTGSPDYTSGNWRQVGYDFTQCDTSAKDCRFKNDS